mgnify:CR=1 FL=1
MTQKSVSDPPKRKTRWGCLTGPIILAVFLSYAAIHDEWYRRQPIEVHLRDIFSESGFQVPDDVSKIRGQIGFKDFQGDFSASVTFRVRPDQVDQFMDLSGRGWTKPDDFKPWDDAHYFLYGDDHVSNILAPAGTCIIEQWGPGEHMSRYGVNKTTHQIFFERLSW